jgi:hypothetical protein
MGRKSVWNGIRQTLIGRRAARATGRGRQPAVAAALLIAATLVASSADAANLCIAQNANSTIFVPRFRAPARGKCKPATAIVVNGLPANGASGQACTTDDGTRVLIGLTAFIDGWPSFFEATVPLPIGSPGVILRHASISSSNAYVTTAALCSAP